ncbi:NfeD family protein [Demequina capsici]|uniref:NfeD family protein n=1 Tax=Demequina capsici TaxID=3075620 RepID=A0AA96F5N2_9MICO|nr:MULTISPECIES: NfeD family protein [unclassified Demequina]WNM23215.1 NfeD family protein [Demequina sp. OYTSA14]WNM26094.1 NfeD family protein [Demequina sp. PMTSA13]
MDSLWWYIGALALGIAEIFTLDLTLLMFAGGALAGGVAAQLGAPLWLSIVVFAGVSSVLLFAVRPYLLRSLRKKGPVAETNAARLVGMEAFTLDEITERSGRVKLAGEVWTARTREDAPTIAEGVDAVVIEIKGATAIVASNAAGQAAEKEE